MSRFVKIGDQMLNTRYIKSVSPAFSTPLFSSKSTPGIQLIIANTEVGSIRSDEVLTYMKGTREYSDAQKFYRELQK
jgi:hypothetical protein